MQQLMDPSRNMSRYRNLLNGDEVQPPVIPFYPVVKKDLTFIHLANDSKLDGLVNFEKLRMIAKEVQHHFVADVSGDDVVLVAIAAVVAYRPFMKERKRAIDRAQ